MSHEELATASEYLRNALELVDDEDLRERIESHAGQLADLAERDRGPDHGRLARHMTALGEIGDALDGEAADHVDAAYDQLKEYRKGVEGV